MKQLSALLTLFIVLASSAAEAQINVADSSVQVIGYWRKNEKETYNITTRKYKVQNGDTLDVESTKYQATVTIIDSAAKSYTVEWLYKNYDVSESNPLVKSIADATQNLRVVLNTDEYGSVKDVANWEEIRDQVKKAYAVIRSKVRGNSDAETVIKNLEAQFSTKQAIETTAIPDILQFYMFHGGKYIVNQPVEGKMVSNGIPGHPVDVNVTVSVTQFDPENDNTMLVVHKEFDKKQMSDATFALMQNMMKSAKANTPTREDIGEITLTEGTASQIHGSTGWIIYSFQSKQTSTSEHMQVEEREIEIEIR